ncbi:MAG: glycosyltransferase family 4 protein [Dehalococcoidales bacterium]|nr:glycosyltransferase family 4 protein [Dehalococcoidales bacterium]
MKVLMMTPTVDPLDPVHGFAYAWMKRIAGQVDKLSVITLVQRNTEPDRDFEVYALDTKGNSLSKWLYLNRLLLKLVPQADLIFTHMYPVFPVLAWPFSRLFAKPLVMWFCHGHISLMTRLSHALVNRVVTASEESFRIRSRKIRVIGHGIDVERFAASTRPGSRVGTNLLSVGRISPVKDYATLVEAASILVSEYGMKDIRVMIVGGPASISEERYLENVESLSREIGIDERVEFVGPVPYNRVAEFYNRADLFVSASQTGSIDKAVMEAMVSGNLIVTCNEAFFPFLGRYRSKLTFQKNDPHELAKKIAALCSLSEEDKDKIRLFLKSIVEADHSLDVWLPRLICVFQEVLVRR